MIDRVGIRRAYAQGARIVSGQVAAAEWRLRNALFERPATRFVGQYQDDLFESVGRCRARSRQFAGPAIHDHGLVEAVLRARLGTADEELLNALGAIVARQQSAYSADLQARYAGRLGKLGLRAAARD